MRKGGLQRGFSTLETVLLLAVVVAISSLIFSARADTLQRQRNDERQRDIQELRVALEDFFTTYNRYPSLNELNDSTWRDTNIKSLQNETYHDPSDGNGKFVVKPRVGSYSYHVTTVDGTTCGSPERRCTHYVLSASLEGGTTYTKTNLN